MEYNYPPYRTELPRYPEEPQRQPRSAGRPSRPHINVLLFLLTVVTTLFAGAMLEGVDPSRTLELWYVGIPFSVTLLSIIGLHEFGHYMMCRRHGVDATLPYFIPAPTIIGTLGAVIKIRAPITSTKALFDIGAAGPIAGFLVTLPALYYGLEMSEVREAVAEPGSFTFGDPLVMKLAIRIVLGEIPEGFTVYVSSIAFAGWVGLLVTAFNLLPIGQLDGGHIAYALLGKRQAWLGYSVFYALFPLTFFWWGWFIWIIMGLVMRIRHPTGITPVEPLDRTRKILGIACFIIFAACFVPVPLKGMGIMEFIRTFIW
ncbi:site-2 protease family protein [candidate division KSB1 bacterium]